MFTLEPLGLGHDLETLCDDLEIVQKQGERSKLHVLFDVVVLDAGVAEPVGALIGYALLLPFLTPDVLSNTLAFVAGIMVYISFDEILPMAHRYGREHLVILGVVAGMGIMSLSLWLLG